MKISLIWIGVLTLQTLAFAEPQKSAYQYDLLSKKRETIQFPKLSETDKKKIFDQVKFAFTDLYVNRLEKMSRFGNEVDPLPQLEQMEREGLPASEADFHSKILKIFFKQRDLHLSYILPKPYACYASFLPFSLYPVLDETGSHSAAVKTLRTEAEILALAPDLIKVTKGDLLVQINHSQLQQGLDEAAEMGRGANPGARFRRAVERFTLRGHTSALVPQEDQVELTFQKADGSLYNITLPWLVRIDPDCLKPQVMSIQKHFPSIRKKIRHDEGIDEFQVDYQKFYNLHEKEIREEHTTDEPSIRWSTIANPYGVFGVLRLDSFAPTKLSSEKSKELIRSLLEKELAKTDGLIIDLRNNGGGQIGYGESLVELFSPSRVSPLNFKLLNTKGNYFFVSHAEPGPFLTLLDEAIHNGTTFTGFTSLSTPNSINSGGQSYFKPVAIFTNGSCYSTCDMFTASMQDHRVTEVWGEELQTGAGGANNWNNQDMFGLLPEGEKGPFALLPDSQEVGYAWRQVARVESHAGEILEDQGAVADHVIPAKVQDIVNDSEVQFLKISERLKALNPEHQSFGAVNSAFERDTRTPELLVKLDYSNTDQIKTSLNGKEIDSVSVEVKPEIQTANYSLDLSKFQKTTDRFEVQGFLGQKPVWRKILSYRKVPAPFLLSQDLDISFQTQADPFVVFNEQEKDSEGWHLEPGAFHVGGDKQYENNVITTASLFLDLSQAISPSLSFELEGATEKDYDFVSVNLVEGKKVTSLLDPVSGSLQKATYTYDLKASVGKTVEIQFVFTSDAGVTDKGVWLRNLKITK